MQVTWKPSRWWQAGNIFTRRNLRNSGPWLIFLCAVLGAGIGLVVVALHELVGLLHAAAFHLAPGRRLSAGIGLARFSVLTVPPLGGLGLGLFRIAVGRWRRREIVDPIEANAMRGGQMSLLDSARLALTTVISNAAGASVGMEAAYSQMGSGLLSRFGQVVRLRRRDLRIFVGAGAAAAISAAFNAPLAGAFYAFELVLGSYNAATLAQIAVASMAGSLVVRALVRIEPIFHVHMAIGVPDWLYAVFAVLGVAAAPLAVGTMRLVAILEVSFRRLPLPAWLRPAAGGAAVSLIALAFPQVLGSGQGAIQAQLDAPWQLAPLAGLLIAKVMASALSIGAGFRGGLFSSSLLMGCLFGELAGRLATLAVPAMAVHETTFMLVGMGAVAAGIIGAPVTMVLLALEMTGSFPVSLAVFVGVVVCSAIVRHTFGFSFSTWRFHLRGMPITGAEDVGWLAELTVGRLMRPPRVVPAGMPLSQLRAEIPPGPLRTVFVVDAAGDYLGRIDTAAIHDPDLDDALPGLVALDLASHRGQYLLPNHEVRHALGRFLEWVVEELPVLAAETDRRPIGLLTEPYALRRYSQELESRAGGAIGMPEPAGGHRE